ncbi:MAG TPA: cytochrome c-type biogenesis CcmF C-terminal domain-containing protein [Ignavibacteriaceae bacterium]|nr:cytochrome c-type biogenesis CcmF C-terminal domain-containing protein [Ignavibacteriaceae bacterium]
MIGSIVLTLALASSVIAMVMFYLNFRGYTNTLNYGRIAYHTMTMLVITASTILWYLLLTHQYQYHYVFSYSNNSLNTGFLVSSFWGGQEGSFMLWLLLTSIVGVVLQSYSSKRGDLEPRVMAVFTLATTFLLIMVSPWFKNPFEFIWATPVFIDAKSISAQFLNAPFMQNFIFTDPNSQTTFVKMSEDLYNVLSASGIAVNDVVINGKGLNPQLLNFWMQIHPPTLFTGFSMATVPFAFAMAAMMKNDYRDWVRQAFPWVLAGTGILGLGIMMGGYWAYEMLGWGGYWAWDPVENSSLIPFLVGTASIHTLLVQRKSQAKGGIGRYARTNIILSLMTYILVLYSTFLTRSGILGDASVHSFVDPGMLVYLFLVIFIGSFILLGFGMLFFRWKYLGEHVQMEEGLLSRELALFTSAVVLCASATIVLVGTSAPIWGSAVDTFFYNEMHVPIAIIIGLLNGLSLLIKWKDTKSQEILKKSALSAGGAVLFTILVVALGAVNDVMMILLTLTTAFALFVNLEIAIKIVKGNMKMLGAYVAHIGIALFILGVIGSAAFSEQVDVDLVKNETKSAFGFDMTFTGYSPIENNTKYAFNINLKNGGTDYSVAPVMYISDFNNGLMREPDILTLPTKDFYISPLGYDQGTGENSEGQSLSLELGSQSDFDNATISYQSFIKPDMSAMTTGGSIKMGAVIVVQKDGKTYTDSTVMQGSAGNFDFVAAQFNDANIKVQVQKIDPTTKQAVFIVSNIVNKTQVTTQPKEVLTITASIKPFISFVWIGVLVMFIGFFVSVARRLKESLIG